VTSEREARLCVGVVTGPQGVRGAVRVKSFTEDPADVAAYGPVEDEAGQRRFELRVVGNAKGVVVAKIAGLDDRDAAERLKGTRLYVQRSALPAPEEDEYYHSDLIGLPMALRDGTVFGTVRAVHDYGAGVSLEVAHRGGQLVMVQFTRAIVPVVDIAAGRLVIEPPEGLLDNRPVEADMEKEEAAAAAAADQAGD
jgi:16S rRNA processing protein RimM